MMFYCSSLWLDFRIISVGLNTPLEFLTGFIGIKVFLGAVEITELEGGEFLL